MLGGQTTRIDAPLDNNRSPVVDASQESYGERENNDPLDDDANGR